MNAHVPIKDDTVFSDYCFFVWTGKIDSKTRCGGGFFENGGKISVFKQKLIPVDGALGVKISLVRKYYL